MATVEPGERWTDCIHIRKIVTLNDKFDIGEAREWVGQDGIKDKFQVSKLNNRLEA